MPKTLIRLRREIDAAHQLPFHKGKCHHLHGHRWKIEVAIRGYPKTAPETDPDTGMVMDFGDIKLKLDYLLPDHLSLNTIGGAQRHGLAVPDRASMWRHAMDNPTCEHFVQVLYKELLDGLHDELQRCAGELVYVRVWETPNGDCQYPG